MNSPIKAISAPILAAAGPADAPGIPTPADSATPAGSATPASSATPAASAASVTPAVSAASAAPPDPVPRIRSTLRDGVLAVSLAGEFDLFTCAPLRGLLDEGAAGGARHLVLDAALVTFCDSALLDVLDWWTRSGRSWETAASSRSLRLLLDLDARVRPRPSDGERVVGP
ncbi:STAS domain-containing protein [Streptomyces sp. AB3(2024)]|uniref:STAS domain-containing protein n=1 Tax=Streptomyces sp. AB3(2024) TaxID=3317321 RepID=UPI0035A2B8CA